MTRLLVGAGVGVLVLLLALSRLAAREAVRRQRAHSIAVLRAVRAVIDADDAGPAAVAESIRSLLGLRSCWFERGPRVADRPRLQPDGTIQVPVLFRTRSAAAVLPGVSAIELGPEGRFVLVADQDVPTTIEQRIGAAMMAAACNSRVGWSGIGT